jgi:hypothetical protein
VDPELPLLPLLPLVPLLLLLDPPLLPELLEPAPRLEVVLVPPQPAPRPSAKRGMQETIEEGFIMGGPHGGEGVMEHALEWPQASIRHEGKSFG